MWDGYKEILSNHTTIYLVIGIVYGNPKHAGHFPYITVRQHLVQSFPLQLSSFLPPIMVILQVKETEPPKNCKLLVLSTGYNEDFFLLTYNPAPVYSPTLRTADADPGPYRAKGVTQIALHTLNPVLQGRHIQSQLHCPCKQLDPLMGSTDNTRPIFPFPLMIYPTGRCRILSSQRKVLPSQIYQIL